MEEDAGVGVGGGSGNQESEQRSWNGKLKREEVGVKKWGEWLGERAPSSREGFKVRKSDKARAH